MLSKENDRMKVRFETETEKMDVLVGLRTLQQRQHGDNAGPLWSGIRVTVLEQALACVEATPVEK